MVVDVDVVVEVVVEVDVVDGSVVVAFGVEDKENELASVVQAIDVVVPLFVSG